MGTEKKYYTLANRYIDKLIKLYDKDYFSTLELEKTEDEFIENELSRTIHNMTLAYKEGHCFIMNYLITITGLNKSELEKNGCIEYDTIDFRDINNTYNICKNETPNIIENFEFNRIINSKYDNLICITNYDSLENNLLYNIRNALLHSEFYPYEVGDDYTVNIFNFKNSDFHKIEGKILTLTFQLFLTKYYSNVFATIQSDTNLFQFENLENIFIKDEMELKKVLKNMKVIKIKNDKPNNINKELFEACDKKYGKDSMFSESELQQLNINIQDYDAKSIEENVIDTMLLCIKKYFGNSFYKMSLHEQKNVIYSIYNFIDNPKKSISEWLAHFYDIITTVSNIETSVKKFAGSNKIALKIALYIMKLYNCLYAIQNKAFEDISIDKLDLSDNSIIYNENIDGLFYLSFQKFKLKYEDKSDEEIRKLVYLEILRNSLSHGNISFSFVQNEKGELEEEFIFFDKHNTKERKIYIKLDDVKKLIDSECFLPKNINLKNNNDHVKSI